MILPHESVLDDEPGALEARLGGHPHPVRRCVGGVGHQGSPFIFASCQMPAV